MSSLILRTAARYLIPLLILFSILTLLRGHNLPGGGFVGGLLASTAFALYVFAWDAASAKRALRIDPHFLVGTGLLVALCSGFIGMMGGRSFLTGVWGDIGLHEEHKTAIGTPIFFDVGVYLVVIGASLMIILSLTEQEEKE